MRRLILTSVLLLALTGCAANASGHSHGDASNSATSADGASAAPMGGTYLSVPLSTEVKSQPLFDDTGATISFADMQGKWVVLANMFTTCHEVCPMIAANMHQVAKAVSAANLSDKIEVWAISVDPETDTAERLSAFKALFAPTNWRTVGGTAESLDAVWGFFGASITRTDVDPDESDDPVDWQTGKAARYDITHSNLVIIVDPEGNWRWLDLGMPEVDTELPAKLAAFLSEQGRQNLSAPQGSTWSVQTVLAAISELSGLTIK